MPTENYSEWNKGNEPYGIQASFSSSDRPDTDSDLTLTTSWSGIVPLSNYPLGGLAAGITLQTIALHCQTDIVFS